MAFKVGNTVIVDDACMFTANGISINKGFQTASGTSMNFNLATMPFIKTDGSLSMIFLDSSGKIPFRTANNTLTGV